VIGRVVEVTTEGAHLAKERGFLVVKCRGEELGRVALDDLDAVVGNAYGLTVSSNVIATLAERNVPLVVCGQNHQPAAFLWPADGHYDQGGRISDQAAASKPLKKQLWKQIVRAKIAQQAATLDAVGANSSGFHLLSKKVRSGDPENVEAQAARRYWRLLFGDAFRRNAEGAGPNALLNYGYAVLRAGTARAIMAAGLHPSLGLAHVNRKNAFALVDDCMEPFRPVVDLFVHDLVYGGAKELDQPVKAALARVLITDMATGDGVTPVVTCLERLALSLARCFGGETRKLVLPLKPLPLERVAR